MQRILSLLVLLAPLSRVRALTAECTIAMDLYRLSQATLSMYINPLDPYNKMYHSSAHDAGMMGNIDKCVNEAKGEYCTIIKVLDIVSMGMQPPFSGCCVPKACANDPKDIPAVVEICDPWLFGVTKMAEAEVNVLKMLAPQVIESLPPMAQKYLSSVSASKVPVACGHKDTAEADTVATGLWVFVGIMVSIILLASGVGYFRKVYIEDSVPEEYGAPKLMGCATMSMPKVLKAFSLQENWKLLVDRPERHTNFLDGIRAISFFWVTLGHSYGMGYSPMAMYDNMGTLMKESKNMWFNMVVPSAFFAVDTFFWLGGFLFAYLFAKKLTKMGKKATKTAYMWAPMIYVQRWLRLVPIVIFCTLVAWKWLPLWVSGNVPSGSFDNIDQEWFEFGAKMMKDHIEGGHRMQLVMTGDSFTPVAAYQSQYEKCEDAWWVHSLFLMGANDDMINKGMVCMGHLWYLSAEFEIVWVTPIVMFLYTLHPFGGYIASFVGIWVGIGTSLGMSQKDKLSAFGSAKNAPNYQMDYYMKPWTRCGVYFVGMLFGFLCHDLEAKAKAAKYKIKLSALMTSVLQLVGCGILLFLDMILHDCYPDGFAAESSCSQDANNAWNGLARPTWGIGLSILSVSLLYGSRKGMIASFLEWHMWSTIGKLSFAAYVIHFPLYDFWGASLTKPAHYQRFTQLQRWLGMSVLSLFAAFVMWFVIEAPLANLAKLLLAKIQGGGSKPKYKTMHRKPTVNLSKGSQPLLLDRSSGSNTITAGEIVTILAPGDARFPRVTPGESGPRHGAF